MGFSASAADAAVAATGGDVQAAVEWALTHGSPEKQQPLEPALLSTCNCNKPLSFLARMATAKGAPHSVRLLQRNGFLGFERLKRIDYRCHHEIKGHLHALRFGVIRTESLLPRQVTAHIEIQPPTQISQSSRHHIRFEGVVHFD